MQISGYAFLSLTIGNGLSDFLSQGQMMQIVGNPSFCIHLWLFNCICLPLLMSLCSGESWTICIASKAPIYTTITI